MEPVGRITHSMGGGFFSIFSINTSTMSKSISRAWQAQAKIVWMTSCFSSLCVWSWSFKQLDWPGWVVAGHWGGVHWGGGWDVPRNP